MASLKFPCNCIVDLVEYIESLGSMRNHKRTIISPRDLLRNFGFAPQILRRALATCTGNVSIMDALIAKADAIIPLRKKRKTSRIPGAKEPHKSSSSDRTIHSVTKHTSIPKSFSKLPDVPTTYSHIANKKLRSELNRHTAQASRAKALLQDAEILLVDDAGRMEVEGEMERTWRVGQDEIVKGVGQEAAKSRREWKLDGGPYRSRYTRNGRFVTLPVDP